MADVAQFGVEIPPVKGAKEAAEAFNIVKKSAEQVNVTVEQMAKAVAKAQQSMDKGELKKEAKAAATEIRALYGYQTDATKAATGHGAALSGLATKIAVAVGAYLSLSKAINLVTSAINEAARVQTSETTFKLMIGNANAARTALDQLAAVGKKTIFDDREILAAATALKTAGVDVKNLGTYTQGIAVMAEKAGVSVEAMAQAWVNAIKGRVTSSTLESNTIMQQLRETTGKTMRELREGLQNGTVTSRDFTSALIDAAKHTEILAARGEDYEAKLKKLDRAWGDVKKAFGTPIINALSPMLDEWTKKIDGMPSRAETAGKLMAAAFDFTVKGLQGVADLLDKIITLLENLALQPALVKLHDLLAGKSVPLGPAAAPEDNALLKQLQDMRAREEAQGIKVPGAGLAPLTTQLKSAQHEGSGLMSTFQDLDDLMDKTRDTTNDFAGDLKILIDYWQQYSEIQAFSTTATSRHYHQLQLVEKTIKDLGDPMRDVAALLPGLSPEERDLAKWMAWREAADRAIQQTELRMRAGMASMGDSVKVGLDKLMLSWGTWQEQVSQSVVSIGNAISSGISNGLTDILTGTKSVADGFKQMALSIITDIEHIIIKMLVQLAIQRLLGMVAPAIAGAGAGGLTLGAGTGFARGGPIPGRGSGDTVPALLEPGEFVIRKEAASKIGYARLSHWNRMRGGRRVSEDGYDPGSFGGTPSWNTSPRGQGPVGNFDPGGTGGFYDPTIEPPPLNEPDPGRPSTSAWGGDRIVDNPVANRFLTQLSTGTLSGFGTSPSFGISMFGPTAIPTFWVNYPGVGNVPMAVPAASGGQGWGADPSQTVFGHHHTPTPLNKSTGGMVTSFHEGGVVGYASGGMVSGSDMGHMARSSVVSNRTSNNISVVVNNVGKGRSESTVTGDGMTNKDARELARMIISVVDAQNQKQRRVGGYNYRSRSGA